MDNVPLSVLDYEVNLAELDNPSVSMRKGIRRNTMCPHGLRQRRRRGRQDYLRLCSLHDESKA